MTTAAPAPAPITTNKRAGAGGNDAALAALDAAESWKRSASGGASAALAEVPRPAKWWTGVQPEACPGWEAGTAVLRSLPLIDYGAAAPSREALQAYLDNTWTLTEVLFSGMVGEEAFFVPPAHRLRHPLCFYYGHVAALYVNKLRVAGALAEPVDAALECTLETGVDEMSWDDMSKNEATWPTLERIHEYRAKVYPLLKDFIANHEALSRPITPKNAAGWALVMGFEHERIHLETSSVLMRELPLRLLSKAPQWPAAHPAALSGTLPRAAPLPENAFVAVGATEAVLGKPAEYPTFGWDNEYGAARISVPAFEVQERLVSNGEFLAFVRAGGYSRRELWSDSGWAWRSFRNAKWPIFWRLDGPQGLHQYVLRTLYAEAPLREDLPAVVNRHEAEAYCAWLQREHGAAEGSYRVPCEAEYKVLREPHGAGEQKSDFAPAFGGGALSAEGSTAPNAMLAHGSESPVDAEATNSKGVRGVRGNVWQWAGDWFSALPGFDVHRLYDDFSTPCFDGEHAIIIGGSWVSTGDLVSDFARYHFRPHFFQHAGFRVCRSAHAAPMSQVHSRGPFAAGWRPADEAAAQGAASGGGSADSTGKGYESEDLRNMYLSLHYGSAVDVCDARLLSTLPGVGAAADFPARCAEELIRHTQAAGALGGEGALGRALDVGCATGGAAFALAATGHFGEVVGVDLSRSFIETSNALKETGEMAYERPLEGRLTERVVARVPADAAARAKCAFRAMDACCLSPDLGTFDCVLLGNLLCRLPSPKACLGRMSGANGLVRPGGVLLITTPFTWLESCTPVSSWLGGYHDEATGEAKLSVDGLREMMGELGFEMLEESAMPLLIRETSRKYQLICPTATAWRRIR
jgi:5-histidylcysteine sulfoxide synthase/putative 4-mercaptohistidine N1-methyltranferase